MSDPITKTEILEYLRANLLRLLRTNSGGKSVPSIWLIRDEFGSITSTFDETGEGDKAGGSMAPLNPLHDDRIFRAKESEVIAFLQSFTLSLSEAEALVDEIGIASQGTRS
jgi:hypothetical protein